MALPTKYWSDSLWTLLYSISYSYPEESTEERNETLTNFIDQLGIILPDEHYKFHFNSFCNENPLNLDTKDNLLEWTYNLHSFVNQKLGIPPIDLKNKIHELKNANNVTVTTVNAKPVTRNVPRNNTVSYGMRRLKPVVRVEEESEKHDIEISSKPEPKTLKQQNVVSYGMRRSK